KLEGEQVHAARETADRFFITEISFRRGVGELRSGAVVFRSKNMHAISHAARRDGEHAAKLTAAHHADGRARREHFHGNFCASTVSLCCLRKASTFSRTFVSDKAMMLAARRPAFFA